MKTLFIAAGGPYPPRGGAPQRYWQNINILATRGPVYVLSIGGREPGSYTVPVVAEWIHLDDSDFPVHPGPRAFFTRIFAPRQYSVPDVFATAAINRQVVAMIERVKPDVIILSHWKNNYPAALEGHDNVILDMHNIESLLGTDVQHIKRPWLRNLLLWRWRARERNLVRKTSCAWVCGPNDVAELRRLDPRLPAPIIWPNSINVDYYADVRDAKTPPPPNLQRNGATIIFVGLFSYDPNRLAAAELIDEIVPRIVARIPHVRFLFVGDAPTPRMVRAAQQDSRIIVTGKVADVRSYLALADVSIVPIRTGGGTRAKILESFAAKIPVVSTAKGAEGIDAVPDQDIRIAESAHALAEHALELLSDPQARARQADAAYELVRRSYSWSSLAERLDSALPAVAHATNAARRS